MLDFQLAAKYKRIYDRDPANESGFGRSFSLSVIINKRRLYLMLLTLTPI